MRFAHIADTHIRNLKYHFEYKEVFKQLYKSLKEENVDYIIHCGDIAHTKTQISPEFVDMCREFFENLCAIAPTYIILGNHDGNLRNESRQDAITPIIRALNNKNLFLLKSAGEVRLNKDFTLNVLSVFDEDNWKSPSDTDSINIALYHGAIDRSKTDSNWTLGGDHDITIFDEFDFAFLGDIHKTQKLDDDGRIWYAGSTVQQNFGESLDKGYLLWDIESKDKFTNKLITFKNPKPFVTVSLTEKGNLPRKKPPLGARVRIVSEGNVSLDKVRRAVEIIKFNYSPESVTYLNRAAGKQIQVDAPTGLKKEDLRDIKVQESLMSEYLKEFELSPEILNKVYELNKAYNKQIEDSEDVYRNVNWSLQSLQWDNLFNYGSDNSIDFSKLEGIVGIFGKNYSGKSSIVDTLLYAMYNSTSKSIRKNLNIINQNKEGCLATATIKIDDELYTIERNSDKYIKKLKGVESEEATTDLEFYKTTIDNNTIGLNGTSRQDTDKNVRKYFGSIQDFLMTSMASQLDSLSFINEGSTKRKEFLAKFLDLEIFDKKFKMAKEDSSITKVSMKRLENIDFEAELQGIRKDILKTELQIEKNKSLCNMHREERGELSRDLATLTAKIDSVPTEIIDPVSTLRNISIIEKSILETISDKSEAQRSLKDSEAKFEKIEEFLVDFSIDDYLEQKRTIEDKSSKLESLLKEIRLETESVDRNLEKERLLSHVPCGNKYPNCKFIKDAHEASDLVQISKARIGDISQQVNRIGSEISSLDPPSVNSHIDKHERLIQKRDSLANLIASSRLKIERSENLLFKDQIELEKLKAKSQEYDDNKEAIENLKELMDLSEKLKQRIENKTSQIDICESRVVQLHKKHGSLEQQLSFKQEQYEEYETLKQDYAAYHLFMTCCHPNGVSYEVIKKRLPFINEEISKILTNIVEFEVFITNNGDKLDIFIKHPKHDPRPLEMGSGAEKTIASMAIRLAFLTVSSLPKSDLFILDEPGTALDEENMEGFVRILDMIKGYFKTVLLISHLDSLKDCVDMQINIEKKEDYAYVNI